jgi:hypothetical protein
MKIRHARIYAALIVLSTMSAQRSSLASQARSEEPETVMITLHAKAGAEAELAQVIARHWDTAQRLKLVTNAPHVTLRGTEAAEGAMRTFFVDVFTWRDASIPDAAPKEIQAIWADMNRLVEKRNGRPGLTIDEVALVAK